MTAVEQMVLDTNVVLDCFMFCDPAARVIVSAIESGHWQWIATPDMTREVGLVVDRPELYRWQSRRAATMAALTGYTKMVARPASSTPRELTCGDRDDQKFIDLAWTHRASHLFTRDKALLRLAGRAQPSGVRVLRPIDWRACDDGLPKPPAP